jgi:hypothetical protein
MKAVGLKRAGQVTLGIRTLYDFCENLFGFMNKIGEKPLMLKVFENFVRELSESQKNMIHKNI